MGGDVGGAHARARRLMALCDGGGQRVLPGAGQQDDAAGAVIVARAGRHGDAAGVHRLDGIGIGAEAAVGGDRVGLRVLEPADGGKGRHAEQIGTLHQRLADDHAFGHPGTRAEPLSHVVEGREVDLDDPRARGFQPVYGLGDARRLRRIAEGFETGGIGERAHGAELVGDRRHGDLPRLAERAHMARHLVGLVRRHNAGRLAEDQGLPPRTKLFQDLQLLPLAGRCRSTGISSGTLNGIRDRNAASPG